MFSLPLLSTLGHTQYSARYLLKALSEQKVGPFPSADQHVSSFQGEGNSLLYSFTSLLILEALYLLTNCDYAIVKGI